MKTYDLILKLLDQEPELRNSDKRLIWRVWQKTGFVKEGVSFSYIPYQYFMSKKLPHPETIRRTRQKIQELHPELGAVADVARAREEKAKSKGTWIFREETQTYVKQTNG